ncbi:MAG: DUF2461 domain-containing protein [Pseudomonadota bacterium]|nr:DUF2461 domain-containing protein [Pseudomonadota bacterium]
MTRQTKTASKLGPFRGFRPDFFAFFQELSANNNRDWFIANKARYHETVVDPIVSFIVAMAPRLEQIAPRFVADPRTHGGSMFRIYRDVRFSKDKRPYKEHAACHFRHEAGRDAHAPGFYVHIDHTGLSYGGGIWQPPGEALFRIRTAIAQAPERWQAVVSADALGGAFGGLTGDALKRPPRGFTTDTPHIEDIKRKSFFVIKETDIEAAGSAEFVDEVADTFRSATPLMRFLTEALDLPF